MAKKMHDSTYGSINAANVPACAICTKLNILGTTQSIYAETMA